MPEAVRYLRARWEALAPESHPPLDCPTPKSEYLDPDFYAEPAPLTYTWWGYRHVSGSVQAKRYYDRRDIIEAEDSGFVSEVVLPFEAASRGEALHVVADRTCPLFKAIETAPPDEPCSLCDGTGDSTARDPSEDDDHDWSPPNGMESEDSL
jgi:hypothetical protein